MTGITKGEYWIYRNFLETCTAEELAVLQNQHRGEFNELLIKAVSERATQEAEQKAELIAVYAGAF